MKQLRRFPGRIVAPLVFFLATLLSSCAENPPQGIPKTYSSPTEYTFASPYDQAWDGAVKALSDEGGVATRDKESELLVTDSMPLNKYVLPLLQTALFESNSRVTYRVTINTMTPEKTNIRIQVSLLMDQFVISGGKLKADWLEAYLRQDMFYKICRNVYEDASRCDSIFPEYDGARRVCSGPQKAIGVTDGKIQPPVARRIGTAHRNKTSIAEVKDAQLALITAGYNPGPVDGLVGAKTRSAVKEFQRAKGIIDSGQLETATLTALGLQ